MIKILCGNMFESKCRTLVNTVNCVGVMGKGIALEFKKKYPDMFNEYRNLCKKGLVKPGEPYLYSDLTGTSIINFPTKDNWRTPSQLKYIIDGLKWVKESYRSLGITSVAFPALGCGNGGLNWKTVGALMLHELKDLPIEIEIYAPFETPTEELSPSYLEKAYIDEAAKAQNFAFNNKWLLILEVVNRVNKEKYALHVGRVIFQKICYVMTRSGIKTGFTFTKGTYGPYSEDIKELIISLTNAHLMVEVQLNGKDMVETCVTEDFVFDSSLYSTFELNILDRTVDLFCRMKNTEQAEIMATVLFSYDNLMTQSQSVTENDILSYILDWKKHWIEEKEDSIKDAIRSLLLLGWIHPVMSLTIDEEY